jgi:hypothetical protein
MTNFAAASQAEESLRAHLSEPKVDWEFVKSALNELPVATEASTRTSLANDPMGRSLLIDILAKDPTVEVIEASLRAFPDALVMNVSAYFAASQCQDLDVIRSLVCYSQQQQMTAECPYPWIMMSHISAVAAEAIIRKYPQGVLEQCKGSIHCLLDQTIFSVDEFKRRLPADPSWWEKLILMLKSIEHESLDESKQFHPIHTLVHRVVSKPEFFMNLKVAQHIVWLLHQLRLKYPSLFCLVDGNGDAPLHVALRATCNTGPGIAYARDLVAVLVDSFKKSASLVTREEGRLPLFLGLENGWPCHDVLVTAAPHSLHRRDTVTRLYPFQVAACTKPYDYRKRATKRAKKDMIGDLNVVYALLRQDPLQAQRRFGGVEAMDVA